MGRDAAGSSSSSVGSVAMGVLTRFAPLVAPEFRQDVCVAILLYLIGYAALGGFSPLMEAKRKAWVLSVLCSFGMSLGSLPYVWRLATEHQWVTKPLVYADDSLSLFVMAWFMSFLVLDIAIGLQHYRKEIGFLTGWFHHSLYMAMCVWAVVNGITISAVATMIMEIPTFVMAAGRVYKSMRSDAIFGATFLVTRIVYLGYYIYRLMCDEAPRVTVWPVCVPAMALHVFWFKGFILQQRRLRSPRSEEAEGKNGNGKNGHGKGGKAA